MMLNEGVVPATKVESPHRTGAPITCYQVATEEHNLNRPERAVDRILELLIVLEDVYRDMRNKGYDIIDGNLTALTQINEHEHEQVSNE